MFSVLLPQVSPGVLLTLKESFQPWVKEENVFYCSASADGVSQGGTPILGNSPEDGGVLRKVLSLCKTDYLLIVPRPVRLSFQNAFFDEMQALLESSKAAIVYGSYARHQESGRGSEIHWLTDYQIGSVREDFDFGPVFAIRAETARQVLRDNPELVPDNSTGWYGLRLATTLSSLPKRLGRVLYEMGAESIESSEKLHFQYVDKANRGTQKLLEETFTLYAKKGGFYLPPSTNKVDLSSGDFPVEVSVIIPVKNRMGKVEDAVRSACAQKTPFSFNVIVVDNHSKDGTTESLKALAQEEERLIHLVPERYDLGIGGCWNEAIQHSQCGRFAVQLDSDDLYIDQSVLSKIVAAFYAESVAVVVGSYRLVDRDLKEIPPGLVDHAEWTKENGHNNGLRINGFGAPRAFVTRLVREIEFPNVSYGEDYFMMLALTRHYPMARIFEPLYLCRRWEGNSDASLTTEKMNAFNSYKDKVRSEEILARKAMVD